MSFLKRRLSPRSALGRASILLTLRPICTGCVGDGWFALPLLMTGWEGPGTSEPEPVSGTGHVRG